MKKRELVIATTNQGKLREIKELLAGMEIAITSLKDYPAAPEIVEDGTTFAANALKKAQVIAAYTGKLTMGEDSGLAVDGLGGAPGIYSARFAGPQATDAKNNAKLLRSLRGLPLSKRSCRYHCCIALVDDQGTRATVSGTCGGVIALKPSGSNGFGYDPLFLIPRYGKTFGELDSLIKAKLSHRARALKKLKTTLQEYFARPVG
ncbi:MAG: XTP/dITP diphosphatase [Candidatus Omnitrophica bacterium]|nr:XTP/dITP diphosphatase [Candidatus Omnitrophota bacterium]